MKNKIINVKLIKKTAKLKKKKNTCVLTTVEEIKDWAFLWLKKQKI